MLDRLPENCANGYVQLENGDWRTNIYNLPIIGGGDGGMYSTVDDLFKFWNNLMQGKIVTKETLHQILEPLVIRDKFAYGLGVWLNKEEDTYVPYILGEDCGVSFKSYHNESKRLINSIISNTSHGAWEVTQDINELLR